MGTPLPQLTGRDEKGYPYHYRLYFAAELPFDEVMEHHLAFDAQRTRFKNDIKDHIDCYGLQSPIYMMRRLDGKLQIRRGNNRVVACRELGWTTIPAFIVDYHLSPPMEGWELLPYDQGALQERFFANGNQTLQISRRNASVVAPHKVHSPAGNVYRDELSKVRDNGR